MDFKEFAEQAKRTMNDEGKEMNLYHSAIGIFTEVGELSDQFKKHIFYKKELDIVNINEEVGDILWYISIIARELKLVDDIEYQLSYLDKNNFKNENETLVIVGNLLKLQELSGDTSEAISSIVFYNSYKYVVAGSKKELLYSFIRQLSYFKNISFSEIMDLNIAKLKARYPDKFDSEKALNRDLETERKILEGSTGLEKKISFFVMDGQHTCVPQIDPDFGVGECMVIEAYNVDHAWERLKEIVIKAGFNFDSYCNCKDCDNNRNWIKEAFIEFELAEILKFSNAFVHHLADDIPFYNSKNICGICACDIDCCYCEDNK